MFVLMFGERQYTMISPAFHVMLAATLAVALAFTTTAEANATGTTCVGGSCPIRPRVIADGNTVQNASVARVVCQTPRGRNLGSGTLVDLGHIAGGDRSCGYVLTCGHLFESGTEKTAQITVDFPGGGNFAARLLSVDRQWDLAVLKIARPRAGAVTIATAAPRPGEWLSSCGYGRDGRYWCNRGRARGYVRPEGTPSFETLELSGMARQGDSGGPVLNSRGELVAVLWGTNGQVVGGTYCGRIRTFLARVFGAAGENIQRPVVPIRRDDSGQSRDGKRVGDVVERLRRRLDGLESRLQGSELGEKAREVARGIARDVAREAAGRVVGEFLAGQNQTAVAAWLPRVLTALGWTGPPAIAATVGITLLGRILRRKLKGKQHGDTKARRVKREGGSARHRSGLNDAYAAQLADVYALSGHSPVADATLGREYDKELRRAEESSDGTLAAWASGLRKRVARQFYRIHDDRPTPAEPA